QAEDGGTLWFLTRATSDVAADAPQRPVNVAVRDKDFWASLAGHGQLVRDDARKKEFWNPATEAFFGEGSSPEDPQIVLVRVDVQTAQFWESPGAVATAVELVKAKVTGGTAEPGDSETVRFERTHHERRPAASARLLRRRARLRGGAHRVQRPSPHRPRDR
ncbi:pyridoxamine 5'-phosphate oxidase family protein, partial [Micrococcus luteus]